MDKIERQSIRNAVKEAVNKGNLIDTVQFKGRIYGYTVLKRTDKLLKIRVEHRFKDRKYTVKREYKPEELNNGKYKWTVEKL